MATVHLIRKHKQDEQAVRQHIEDLAQQLAARLGADYRWENDRLEFSHGGATGFVAQKTGEIELYLKLGLLLSPFKGRLERAVNKYLDENLVGDGG